MTERSKASIFRFDDDTLTAIDTLMQIWQCKTQKEAVRRAILQALRPTAPQNGSADYGDRLNALRDAIYALSDKLDEVLTAVQTKHSHLQPAMVGTGNGEDQPKNAFCKHCGQRFAGPRFAALCGACADQGHENKVPAECVGCQQGLSL